MGGYVNLVARQNGGVRKTLSCTGCIPLFFDPRLYQGHSGTIDALLAMYRDCPEQQDPKTRKLAPFDYGLIVFDLDTKTVFDMQGARAPNMTMIGPTMPGDYTFQFLFPLHRLGWLGDRLYDATSEPPLPLDVFPDGLFESPETLVTWCEETHYRIVSAIPKEHGFVIRLGVGDFPAFRIQPPGWAFASFDIENAADMREALMTAGFSISTEEASVWNAWIAEKAERAD